MTAVWSDPDPGWRIRAGGGLLLAQPLSESLRLAHQREDEREAAQLERDREMRAQLAAERRAELLMAGHTPKTQQELFQQVSWAQDRQDAADRKAEERAAELAGRPPAYLGLLKEAAAERKQVKPRRKSSRRATRTRPGPEEVSERDFQHLRPQAVVVTMGRRPTPAEYLAEFGSTPSGVVATGRARRSPSSARCRTTPMRSGRRSCRPA